MKYKNDNDNKYRVNFMRATEELMDGMTVKQFTSYLEKNAEFEDDDSIYLDGKVVDTNVYCLHETEKLSKEFIVTADGRVFYWLSLIQKIELVDEEPKTEVEQAEKELKKALQILGVTGSVALKRFDSFSIKVLVNGKEFGIWDITKKTFVE